MVQKMNQCKCKKTQKTMLNTAERNQKRSKQMEMYFIHGLKDTIQ